MTAPRWQLLRRFRVNDADLIRPFDITDHVYEWDVQFGMSYNPAKGQFVLERPRGRIRVVDPDGLFELGGTNATFAASQLRSPLPILFGEPGEPPIFAGLCLVAPSFRVSPDDVNDWQVIGTYQEPFVANWPYRQVATSDVVAATLTPAEFLNDFMDSVGAASGYGDEAHKLFLADDSGGPTFQWNYPSVRGPVGSSVTDIARWSACVPYYDREGRVGIKTLYQVGSPIHGAIDATPEPVETMEWESRLAMYPRSAPWIWEVTGPDGVALEPVETQLGTARIWTDARDNETEEYLGSVEMEIPFGNDTLDVRWKTPIATADLPHPFTEATVAVTPIPDRAGDRLHIEARASARVTEDDPKSIPLKGKRVVNTQIKVTPVYTPEDLLEINPPGQVIRGPAWLDLSQNIPLTDYANYVTVLNRTMVRGKVSYILFDGDGKRRVPDTHMRPGTIAIHTIDQRRQIAGLCGTVRLRGGRDSLPRVEVSIVDILGAGILEDGESPVPKKPPGAEIPPPPEYVWIPGPPGTPENLRVGQTQPTLTVFWTKSAGVVDQYDAALYKDGEPDTLIAHRTLQADAQLTAAFESLEAGTYVVSVTAGNSGGISPAATTKAVVSEAEPLTPPTRAELLASGISSIGTIRTSAQSVWVTRRQGNSQGLPARLSGTDGPDPTDVSSQRFADMTPPRAAWVYGFDVSPSAMWALTDLDTNTVNNRLTPVAMWRAGGASAPTPLDVPVITEAWGSGRIYGMRVVGLTYWIYGGTLDNKAKIVKVGSSGPRVPTDAELLNALQAINPRITKTSTVEDIAIVGDTIYLMSNGLIYRIGDGFTLPSQDTVFSRLTSGAATIEIVGNHLWVGGSAGTSKPLVTVYDSDGNYVPPT